MPITKTIKVASSNPSTPYPYRIPQAKGRAAREPAVPGAFGDKPAPNHVASKTAGARSDGTLVEEFEEEGGKVGEIINGISQQISRTGHFGIIALQ